MTRLLVVCLLLAMPAHAQITSPEWRACMEEGLNREKPLTGSPVTIALKLTHLCKPLYGGERGGDMDFAVRVIEQMMDGIVVSPSTRLPPVDKRF